MIFVAMVAAVVASTAAEKLPSGLLVRVQLSRFAMTNAAAIRITALVVFMVSVWLVD